MFSAHILLFIIGIIGLLGITVLFPVLAALMSLFRPTQRGVKGSQVQTLEVLVPAHNEAMHVVHTLSSINEAAAFAQVQISTLVAADACTDNTAELARANGARVLEVQNRSKFVTLERLLREAKSEWVVLVDCGTLWPKDILIPFRIFSEDTSLMALAPAYRSPSASLVHRIYWKAEVILKRMENLAGGPVSVHGATVFLRREEATEALKFLAGRKWYNDDVVIPLTMRMLFPRKRIQYAAGIADFFSSVDGAERSIAAEKNARARMMFGNLQWIELLLPVCWRKNPLVGVIALRRLFRVYWAYWFLLSAESACALFLMAILANKIAASLAAVLFICSLLLAMRFRAKSLYHTLVASLASPFRTTHDDKVIWR
jgi:glycosyltransferase involved in cell wall biosynthesis